MENILSAFCLTQSEAAFDHQEHVTIVSLGNLPGLVNSKDDGPFVDLIKEIGQTAGLNLKIEVFPMSRALNNVVNGYAEIAMPNMRPIKDVPYGVTTKSVGKNAFTLYTNISNPITKDDLISNYKQYKIEGPSGVENCIAISYTAVNDFENSIQKLLRQRIDALLWPQEEVDLIIKKLKAKDIKREFFQYIEDIIVIQKGEKGKEMDRILSDAIGKMESTGKLQELWYKIHRPYEDWQPANMKW